jgi:hypothetical protein
LTWALPTLLKLLARALEDAAALAAAVVIGLSERETCCCTFSKDLPS